MEAKSPTPPISSYKTFRGFVDSLLKGQYLPIVIDSTTMDKLSGRNRIEVKAALRYFNLMKPDGTPTDLLHSLYEKPESEREQVWREILTSAYPMLLGQDTDMDISRGTAGQFRDRFRKTGLSNESIIKAERFFLQAAEQAGITVSKYILDSKRSSGRTTTPRTKGAAQPKAGSTADEKPVGQTLSPQPDPVGGRYAYAPDPSLQSLQYNARGLRVTIEIDEVEWGFWNETRIKRFFSGITESLVAQVGDMDEPSDF